MGAKNILTNLRSEKSFFTIQAVLFPTTNLPMNLAELIASGKLELYVAGVLAEREMVDVARLALEDPAIAAEIELIERVMIEFLSPAEFLPGTEEREKNIEIILSNIHGSSIIDDCKFIDKKTYQRVINDPAFIHRLSGREFEQLIAEILHRRRYIVELTKETHDGGKDIIIRLKSDLGEIVSYIECKRIKRSQGVGVDVVRRLYGVVTNDRVNKGLIITNGHFTKEALDFKNQTKYKIDLIDMEKLAELMHCA